VTRADERRPRRGEPLARVGSEALVVGLDGVLEIGSVHLDGIRNLDERAREYHRAHHQVVGERQLGLN
jgi:hypothetical protein